MKDATNGKGSQEGKLKRGVARWLIGGAAVAIAAVLAAFAAGSATVQAAATPGATYAGEVGVVEEGVCGGGTISLKVGADGMAIVQIVLDGTVVGGVLVNDVADPPGSPLVVDLDPGIPIGADGAFDESFEPITGVMATTQGMFEDGSVSGTFGVEALSCVEVPFSAEIPTAPIAGATYQGAISVLDENCGGGTITIVVSEDGTYIASITIQSTNADGSPVSGSATFEPDEVPIGEDGSFSASFFADAEDEPDGMSPPDGVVPEFTVEGTFAGEVLEGTVSVQPSACNPVPFTSQVLEEAAPTATEAPTAVATAVALPTTGGGASGSGVGGGLWAALAATLGALGLVAGLALLRRREA